MLIGWHRLPSFALPDVNSALWLTSDWAPVLSWAVESFSFAAPADNCAVPVVN